MSSDTVPHSADGERVHRPRYLHRNHTYASRLEQQRAKRERQRERDARLPALPASAAGPGYGCRPNGVTTSAAPRGTPATGRIAFEIYYSWRRS